MTDVVVVLVQEGRAFDAREWVEAAQGLAMVQKRGIKARGYLVRNARQREHLAVQLIDNSPPLVFIAVGREQVPGAIALLNLLRSILPKTTIAVGGTYGTLLSHEFTSHQAVSAVALGEWVEAVAELGEALTTGGSGADINGVWWRGRRGWELTARRTYNPDLDVWPDPAVMEFRAPELARLTGGTTWMLASRGFPFQTLFNAQPILRHLQNSDSYYLVRPPKRVVKEAQHLAVHLGAREFSFADFVFPWDTDWTKEFAGLWVEHVRRPFHIRSAAEHMSRERLSPLKEAGLRSVELCLESGNDVLRARHSDINRTNPLVREVLERCGRLGVETTVRLLLGLPHETPRSLQENLAFAESMPADHYLPEIYVPWPESTHFAEMERSLTGSTVAHARARDIPEMRRDVVTAYNDVVSVSSRARAKRHKPAAGVAFDGLFEYERAIVRAPLEASSRVIDFSSPTGRQEVIALRVPSELTWKLTLPSRPVLEFGILIEPALPGERTRVPVSFSAKVTQGSRTYRVFQKILIQALDPDSRRWHWFKLPLSTVRGGKAELTLENLVFGSDPDHLPAEDIWVGWAKVNITSLDHTLERGIHQLGDFEE